MPPVVDPNNLYSETRSDKLSPVVAKHLPRVYVPNRSSNDVWVIDPATLKVVDKFKVGINPQHVVPSWDLKTLWVNNNAEGRTDGSVTPIDPITGKPGKNIPVDDPYNMYFTPDGSAAIVVAEAHKRLDFRDPHTMAHQIFHRHAQLLAESITPIFPSMAATRFLPASIGSAVPRSISSTKKVVGYLKFSNGGMPQDVRISPDGKVFYVADMKADGRFHRRRRQVQSRSAISKPASALTVFIRAETARSSTSPTAVSRASTARPKAKAASASLISRRAKSKRLGRFPAAAARTWATSASTANSFGSPAVTTTRFTLSTPPRQGQNYSRQNRAPRLHGLAATGTVLPRPYGQFALATDSLRDRCRFDRP